jgi:putative oxygen-independent coproporphyrinogen III oxidase
MDHNLDLGIYLHFPFCQKRCHYCDFTVVDGGEVEREAYVNALLHEIELRSSATDRPVTTIYIGGGTPSLLTSDQLQRISKALKDNYSFDNDIEWSSEANPESATSRWLDAALAAGINRLSLGVQSLEPDTLKGLGRLHNRERVGQAVGKARSAGFGNISLDLIYGWPGEDSSAWERTLQGAVDLQPQHLSLYGLTMEEGTPYNKQVEEGHLQPPDSDCQADQMLLAASFLERAGYRQYEISNWSRPGLQCRHNLNYWQRGEYIGLGLGAHSFLASTRFRNTLSLEQYLSGDYSQHEAEVITPELATVEWFFLGLRLCEGIDMTEWDSCVIPSKRDEAEQAIERFLKEGLLIRKDSHVKLTQQGQLLANDVMAEFL